MNEAKNLIQQITEGIQDKKGKKIVLAPQLLTLPAPVKRSSGVAANFLCDNSSYLLGVDDKGKPKRTLECFQACKVLHQTLLDGVDSPAARAVLAFFQSWRPEEAASHPALSPVLNEIMAEAVAMQQPPSDKGKRLKLFYITQVAVKPPTFVIFVNDRELMHFSYTRYLENKIREAFGFRGTSLKFLIRERKEKDQI